MTITAAKAGEALSVVATKLLENEILQAEGYAVLQRVAGALQKDKEALTWGVEVDRGAPILFSKVKDKGGKTVTPSIVAKKITINQIERKTPPFSHLDIALEIDDEYSQPLSRWHLDLANATDDVIQSGPLVHLQYGGHHHNAGHLDHPLRTPRWCHPPMELALLSEVVAANFFEDAWVAMREDPNWCKAICLYQSLCYSHYVERLTKSLSVSSSTSLNTMWATEWVDG
jgi:hypothetical protein